MSNFSKNTKPTAEDVQEAFNSTRNQNRFHEKLDEKYRAKGYTEENKWWYGWARFGVVAICLFMAASAFPFFLDFFSGHLAYLGTDAALMIGGGFAVVSVLLPEYLRVKNAASFLYDYFFLDRVVVKKMAFAIFFTLFTAVFSILGIPKATDLMRPKPAPIVHTDKTPDEIRAIYEPQIAESQKTAANFYSASSWAGKLDAPNQRKYNGLLASTEKLRADMSAAITRLDKDNSLNKMAVDARNAQIAAKYSDTRRSVYKSILFIILVLEVVFWLAFYKKEEFERLAHVEKTLGGDTPPPQNGGGGGRKPSSNTKRDDFFQPLERPVYTLHGDGLQNRKDDSAIQSERVVLQTTWESLNNMITYFDRAVTAKTEAKQAELFASSEKIGEELKKHGFRFRISEDRSTLLVFSPNMEADDEMSRKRNGRTVAIIKPVTALGEFAKAV